MDAREPSASRIHRVMLSIWLILGQHLVRDQQSKFFSSTIVVKTGPELPAVSYWSLSCGQEKKSLAGDLMLISKIERERNQIGKS